MVKFLIGFILGAYASLFLYACMIAAHNADERMIGDKRNEENKINFYRVGDQK